MAANASVVMAMKTLFSGLAFVMLAMDVWAIGTGGLAPCVDLRSRWLDVTLLNLYIHVVVIGAWIVYKESSWITAAVIIFLTMLLGSIITSVYIAMQFFKLSPEEASKDPIYFVLVRHQKRDAIEQRTRGPSVLTSRVIISALGCLALGAFIYVLIVDGSPFRAQVFTRCTIVTMIDVYFNILTISVWIAYKESSWISAFFWILSLVCFGGIATCVYIVRQLFYLSLQQPIFVILFKSINGDLWSSDPLLMAQTNA